MRDANRHSVRVADPDGYGDLCPHARAKCNTHRDEDRNANRNCSGDVNCDRDANRNLYRDADCNADSLFEAYCHRYAGRTVCLARRFDIPCPENRHQKSGQDLETDQPRRCGRYLCRDANFR